MISVDFENWKNGRVPHEINNFSALVFMLLAKADRVNREKIRREWPGHVEMWEAWMAGDPDLCADPVKKCNRIGCENDGTLFPVLQLRVDLQHCPAECIIPTPTCEPCTKQFTAQDFIGSYAQWDRMAQAFELAGKTRPKRNLSTLVWRPIPPGVE